MAQIIDSYSETNQNTSAADYAEGQSFTGDGGILNSAKFYLKKAGSPTGSAYAKIYAHSGTFGTSSVPTGSPLATSGAFDISTLTTSFQLITFTFTGANKITLTNGTKYIVTLEFSGYTPSYPNYVWTGIDTSSPTHGGNLCYKDSGGSWNAVSAYDTCFYVYKDDATTTTSATTSSTTSTSTSITSVSTIPVSAEKIIVSKSGVDALKATNPNDFIFHSDYNTFKIVATGTATFAISAGDSEVEKTIAHGLSYTPVVAGFAKVVGDVYVLSPNEYGRTITDGVQYLGFLGIAADATNVIFIFNNSDLSAENQTVIVRYYLFEVPN